MNRAMDRTLTAIRHRFDRLGLLLSCLCALHCVAGVVIVLGLGFGSSLLLAFGLAVFAVLLFVKLLGLPMPIVGPWLGGM